MQKVNKNILVNKINLLVRRGFTTLLTIDDSDLKSNEIELPKEQDIIRVNHNIFKVISVTKQKLMSGKAWFITLENVLLKGRGY